MYENNYLMHYGVKGMKWGVRHNYVPIGRSRKNSSSSGSLGSKKNRGKSIVSKWEATSKNGSKKVDKKKVLRNVLLATAGISAATVAGLELYKLGKMSSDAVLKRGTLVQSVAVSEKTEWGKSFYVAASQDDRRKILKNFSGVLSKEAKEAGASGRVTANMFTNNNNTVNIAGRKNLRKAYKSVYGTNKGFGKYIDKFNTFDEAKRKPMLDELQRRGFGGFKDQAGMKKWWGGETPMVLNGTKSGFKLRNKAEINLDKLNNIPVKDVGTKLRVTEERGIKVFQGALAGSLGVQAAITTQKRRQRKRGA